MIHVSLHSYLNQFHFFQRFRTGSKFDNENNTHIQLLLDLPSRYRYITIVVASDSPPPPQIHFLAASILRRDLTLTSQIPAGAPPSPHCQPPFRRSLPQRLVGLATTTLSHRNWASCNQQPSPPSGYGFLPLQPLHTAPRRLPLAFVPTEPNLPTPVGPLNLGYPVLGPWCPAVPSGYPVHIRGLIYPISL